MMLFLACLILAPSAAFLVASYWPSSIICSLFLIIKLSDFQNKQEVVRTVLLEPIRVAMLYVLFYTLQLRELKRFNEQEKSEQKSDQMKSILDT